jgi:Glycosyl transferase 4-like domain
MSMPRLEEPPDPSEMKNVLIVSPYFPPSTLAGVHRARHLAKHLPSAGWWPVILCVDEAYHEERLDFELGSLVPPSVEIVKTRAIPAKLTRPFKVGDIGLRSWFQLRRAISGLLRSRDIEAVLITGSPYYPMLLASEITRRFKVPVILDFQDPWVSAAGAQHPLLSKPGLSHWLAKTLEPQALRKAAFVTSVSDIQNMEMAALYPWIDSSRMAAIPIGGDPEDFEQLRLSRVTPPAGVLDPAKINLSFAGTFMPRSGAPVRALLGAFARLRQKSPALANRIRLNFIGTSNRTEPGASPAVLPIAIEAGVADAVHEIPQRLPYAGALSALVHSEGLLLVGSDEPHYTASKIYPALMSGRPYLSLFHDRSSAHRILKQAGGGIALAFGNGDELRQLERPLAEAISILAEEPESLGRADPAAYAPFEARMIAMRFAEIFDEAVRVSGCQDQRCHKAGSRGALS